MEMSIHRKHNALKVVIVLVLTNLLIMPGFTLAEIPNAPPNEPLHKPAYIQGIQDLVDVEVVPRSVPFQPLPPASTDVDIIELVLQLNESLILGYLEDLTSFGPRLSGTEACDQAAHYLYDSLKTWD